MNMLKPLFRPSLARLALAAAASLVASLAAAPAHAQWMWKDDGGRMVVSDQPPPANIPLSRIVKAPKQRPVDVAPMPVKEGDAPASTGAKAEGAKVEAPKSLAERDLDYKQRQKESAEAAKKSADETAKSKAQQENCSAARANLAGLQTGGRNARVNEKGERTFLDDAQRQGEISKTQSQVAQYCK